MMRRFRQFPQIGGKRGGIPSGWVEVEYIETKGAQWIETGVAPSLDMKLECGIYFTVMVDEYFCSCRINTGNTRYYLVNINATYGLVTTKSSWPGASVKLPSEFVSTRHDVVATIGRDSVSIEVDGTKNEFQDSVAVISSKTLPLFGGKVNDSDVANAFSRAGTRCYYAKFTSFGSVVRSFVPVRDAVTNEGAMCDVLTGEIYHNQGTGAFVVGPDKALPYDYEVEWLQSDGTAYVDTDLDFSGFGLEQLPLLSSTGLVSFESVADITANNSRAYGFGYSVAIYHGARMYVGQGKKYPDSSNWVNNRFYTTGYSLEENNANAVEFSISTNAAGKQSTRVAIGVCENGSFTQIKAITAANAATSTGVTNSGMKFCLLGLNRNGSPIYTQTCSNTRLHRLSVVYDGVPIGSFIPVVKDGIGYFYDGITGKLFGNSAASGALIIGPRVG